VDLQKQNCTNKIGTDKILLLLCAAYPESLIDGSVYVSMRDGRGVHHKRRIRRPGSGRMMGRCLALKSGQAIRIREPETRRDFLRATDRAPSEVGPHSVAIYRARVAACTSVHPMRTHLSARSINRVAVLTSVCGWYLHV
jgi:hypothetical protein